MIKQYDAQEEARLVATADSVEMARVEYATRMNDLYEKDGWDEQDHLKFNELQAKHDGKRREGEALKAEIEAMRVTKPVDAKTKAQSAESPLMRWLKDGADGLSQEEQIEQEEMQRSYGAKGPSRRFVDPTFKAVITSGNNTQTLDTETVQSVVDGLHDFGGAIDCFTVAMTGNGNDIKYPVYDDGEVLAVRNAGTGNNANEKKVSRERAAQTEGTLSSFQEVTLTSYPAHTQYLDISRYWNEDVNWDVASFVRRTLMRRMGRRVENDLTIANGTDAPTGLEQVAGEHKTGAANTTLSWELFVDLVHSIDPAYLRGEMGLYGYPHRPGKTGFMTSWTFLGTIKKLKDQENRPLIIPSIQDGSMDMLLGYPVFVNQELSDKTWGSGNTPIYFGNFGYMVVRFAGAGLMIEEHYDSATALTNSNRYLGRLRYDSNAIAPKTSGKIPMIKGLIPKA